MVFNNAHMDSNRTLFMVFSSALKDYVGHVLPSLHVHKVEIRTFSEWSARQRRRHFPNLPKKMRDDTPAVVVRLKSHPLLLKAMDIHFASNDGPTTGEQALDDWATVLTNPALLEEAMELVAPRCVFSL